ncbi:hypothetical protein LPUS_11517 [Lasallia pustulata]|uniref:NTF2-like domain n=1 Tax=Lasallia pustulata TaxID=136370 RepID=A0A1W5DC07_9LECA|nr:hypothetical protein LPUS_11517 [Lasallia pustulata]
MSSLKAIYQTFLASPNASALAHDASLNYITTLTTINSATAVIKHLRALAPVLKKKQEKVLSTVEADNAICMDVETTVEFVMGGGAYLPGLDDNFLADRVVIFPIVHIVHFDATRKIQQIRLYWDQGSLLKLVDVIGSRAKNWPIRDGKDQARLISSSAAAVAGANGATTSSSKDATRDPNEVIITSKATSPRKHITGDPHASLSLFGPREIQESVHKQPAVAPRASAKPPPRDYHDLFVGNDSDVSAASTPASKPRAASPHKGNHPAPVAAKGGAGKNFQPSRLFETENEVPGSPQLSPDKYIKPHPEKFNHFDFADGSDEPNPQPSALPSRPKSKHGSQWNFEDFITPEKIAQKVRSQDVRHFGWGDDAELDNSAAKNPKVDKPRPDAQTHFDFHDAGTPAADKRPGGHPRGQGQNNGLSLYQNNVYDEEGSTSPEKKGSQPLSTVTNLKDRRKDFAPHFSLADDSPAAQSNDENKPAFAEKTHAKAVQTMTASWDSYDQSPDPAARNGKAGPLANGTNSNNHGGRKENYSIITGGGGKIEPGIKTGGDGMGGKKGIGRSWGFGDESDEDGKGGVNGGKFLAAKRQLKPKEEEGIWEF